MTTVEEMKTALLSNGGLDGVRVTVVTPSSVFSDQEQSKITSVNKSNNFQYVNGSVIVWRAYGVGNGKTVTIKSSRTEDNYRWFDEPFSEGRGFRRVGGQPARQPDRAVKRDDALLEQDHCSHLFSCPVDGCVRVFQRVSG